MFHRDRFRRYHRYKSSSYRWFLWNWRYPEVELRNTRWQRLCRRWEFLHEDSARRYFCIDLRPNCLTEFHKKPTDNRLDRQSNRILKNKRKTNFSHSVRFLLTNDRQSSQLHKFQSNRSLEKVWRIKLLAQNVEFARWERRRRTALSWLVRRESFHSYVWRLICSKLDYQDPLRAVWL